MNKRLTRVLLRFYNKNAVIFPIKHKQSQNKGATITGICRAFIESLSNSFDLFDWQICRNRLVIDHFNHAIHRHRETCREQCVAVENHSTCFKRAFGCLAFKSGWADSTFWITLRVASSSFVLSIAGWLMSSTIRNGPSSPCTK